MQHVGVHIEDESGAVTAAFAETGLDPRIVSRAPMDGRVLRFIDPYGDLLVNQPQLPVLMAELHQIHAAAPEEELRRHIEQLLSFLEGAKGAHKYVRFLGD
jgi:hypothetical protein